MGYGKYKGKSMRPGGGGRFKKMVDAMEEQGYPEARAAAIAAAAGRKKYGPEKFSMMATKGRKRASRTHTIPA